MRRREDRRAAEADWVTGWPGPIGSGTTARDDDDLPRLVATLWIPDPEARHMWREYNVRERRPARPERGALGYRREGA